MKRLLFGMAVCSLLSACDKDQPKPAASAEPPATAAAAPAASAAPAAPKDDEGGW